MRQNTLIYSNNIMSAWNDFVKKIYWENKKTNKNFQFTDALKEASRRKGEMGTHSYMKSKKRYRRSRGSRKRRGTRRH